MSKRKFKVGDRAWQFQPYARTTHDHFVPYRVRRIEGRSYIMDRDNGYGLSVSFLKSERKGSEWCTDQEREDDIWMRANRHSIASAVSMCRDVTILRKIAELIGWKSV